MLRNKSITKIVAVLVIGIGLLIASCTEPFIAPTLEFEDLLIIDASITDELKQHDIRLSRSYQEDSTNVNISSAKVYIKDNNGNQLDFFEVKEGLYRSNDAFRALPGMEYQLFVTDEKGEEYLSDKVMLPEKATVDNVRAARVLNDDGVDGVEIYVDGSNTTNTTSFFRYEFVETYKFESFFKPTKEFRLTANPTEPLELVEKQEEERICYVSNKSNTILLTATTNLGSNSIKDFPVTFINRRNRKVALRYSILVRQLSSSRTAYEFYNTLQNFSSSESLFSQIQPGLLVGNIEHVSNSNKKVVGLFEVVSISEKRLFFNYKEIFGNDIPYLGNCEAEGFGINSPLLLERIESGAYQYTSENPPGIFNISSIRCIDCTLFGTAEVPEFWTE